MHACMLSQENFEICEGASSGFWYNIYKNDKIISIAVIVRRES